MKHWHVLTGMEGGYMPDSNSVCESIDEAREMAKELAQSFADDDPDSEGVAHGQDLYTIEVANASDTHLRTYVEVTECNDENCGEEE